MLNKYLMLFIPLFTCTSILLYGQESRGPDETGRDLRKALSKAIRVPRSRADKEESYAFALKFVLSANGKIDTILASKYTPEEMKPSLTLIAHYENVHWEGIFKRKLKKGDALIVPISVYCLECNTMNFHENNVDDLFNFQFPGKAEGFTNCVLMETLVVHYTRAKV